MSMKLPVDERLAKDVVMWLVKRAGFKDIMFGVIDEISDDINEGEDDEVKRSKQFVFYCIKAHNGYSNGTILPPEVWNPMYYYKKCSSWAS